MITVTARKQALALALITTLAAPLAFAESKKLALDPAQSQIGWLAKKVTGQHNGSVALKSGEIEVDGNALKGGNFEIDMTSIKVLDIKDPENNAKLTGHLKSDDFFGVEKFPTSTFKITSVKPIVVNKKSKIQVPGTHEVTGDLTIKGTTHPVTFPVTLESKDGVATAKGKVTVDRTQYNVRYGSGKFFENLGDKTIYDNFEISLDLKAKL